MKRFLLMFLCVIAICGPALATDKNVEQDIETEDLIDNSNSEDLISSQEIKGENATVLGVERHVYWPNSIQGVIDISASGDIITIHRDEEGRAYQEDIYIPGGPEGLNNLTIQGYNFEFPTIKGQRPGGIEGGCAVAVGAQYVTIKRIKIDCAPGMYTPGHGIYFNSTSRYCLAYDVQITQAYNMISNGIIDLGRNNNINYCGITAAFGVLKDHSHNANLSNTILGTYFYPYFVSLDKLHNRNSYTDITYFTQNNSTSGYLGIRNNYTGTGSVSRCRVDINEGYFNEVNRPLELDKSRIILNGIPTAFYNCEERAWYRTSGAVVTVSTQPWYSNCLPGQ